MMIEYVDHIDGKPKVGIPHKQRVATQALTLMRLLGHVPANALKRRHVDLYVRLRGQERVVHAQQRKGESDTDWNARKAAARHNPDAKSISTTSIRHELATLRRAQAWALDEGRPAGIPIKLPKQRDMVDDKRPKRRLDELEVIQLIQAAPHIDTGAEGVAELIEVLAWSGRRPSEVYALTVGDCTRLLNDRLPRHRQLVCWTKGKGGVSRGWSPITQPALEAIRRRVAALGPCNSRTLLWTNTIGNAWSSSGFPDVFTRVAELAKVGGVRVYDLRHHACAQIYRALGNAHEAVEFSGHKTIKVFIDTYAYALDGGAESAAGSIGYASKSRKQVA